MSDEKLSKGKGMLVLVRIRGITGIKTDIKDSLKMLRLHKKHTCVVIPNNDVNWGMCKKVKDFITWGEIDEETLKLLKDKRTKKTHDKQGKEVDKKFYSLHPPVGGFERKGIKTAFGVGGALGYRGAKINELIKRMI
jgi:large subunit ribosomal protein L30